MNIQQIPLLADICLSDQKQKNSQGQMTDMVVGLDHIVRTGQRDKQTRGQSDRQETVLRQGRGIVTVGDVEVGQKEYTQLQAVFG